MLYFISDRDGFNCIWARRLNPESKRPEGEPFAVHHIHHPQRSPAPLPDLGMGVAHDKLVLNILQRKGNIWMADFKP